MSKFRGTPGPWAPEVEGGDNVFGEVVSVGVLDAGGFPVAEVVARPILSGWSEKFPQMRHWAEGADDGRTQVERTPAELAANVRLIAAAPDLLGAARAAADWLDATLRAGDVAGGHVEVSAAELAARAGELRAAVRAAEGG